MPCNVSAHLKRALVPWLQLAVTASLTLFASTAVAQNKWIDASGRIHYSDLPPPAKVRVLPMGGVLVAYSATPTPLPPELAEAVKRHPVVFYTTPDCTPCQQARALLAKRGLPYTEKTVSAGADMEEFRKLGFTQATFPSVLVGKERTQGFEPAEWSRLFNAAGYPENGVLPPSYKQLPATPLAPRGNGASSNPSGANRDSGTIGAPSQRSAMRF